MSQPPAPLFSPARHRAHRDPLAPLPQGADFLAPIIAETIAEFEETISALGRRYA